MGRWMILPLLFVSSWMIHGLSEASVDSSSTELSREDLIRTVRDSACMKCHQGEGVRGDQFAAVDPPLILKASDRFRPEWLVRWLVDPQSIEPGTRMPHALASLPADQREETARDIVHFLFARDGVMPEWGPEPFEESTLERGEELFTSIGCAACHDGTAISARMTDRTTLSMLTEELQDSHRWHPSGRMPQIPIDEEEARALATWLVRGQSLDGAGNPVVDEVQGLRYELHHRSFHSCDQLLEAEPSGGGQTSVISNEIRPKDNDFGIRFLGSFHVAAAGAYTFALSSDDGSVLWINGEKCIDNDGNHGTVTKEVTLQLEAGWHPIQLCFWQAAGPSFLELTLKGPGIPEARPFFAEELRTRSRIALPNEPSFRPDPPRIIRGGRAYSAHGCNACHEPKATPRRKSWAEMTSGNLGCLGDEAPKGGLAYGFSQEAQDGILQLIAEADSPVPEVEIEAKWAVADAGCLPCHVRDGIGGPSTDKNRLFRGTAELGDEGRLAPWLTGVGTKLRPDVIQQTVTEGLKVRPYVLTRMPAYPQSVAGHVSDRLVAADNEPPRDPHAPEFSLEARTAGHQLVGTEGFRCIDCHVFAGQPSLGEPAYDLAIMAERLQPRWFLEYMKDPQSKRPGTRMPTFWFPDFALYPDLLEGNTDAQVDAIWTYLSAGSSAPFPKGLIVNRNDYDLIPAADEPTLVGVFMTGLSARVVAVGYPERASIAWDMENLRLGKAWRGEFINVQGTWAGRAGALENPAGDDVLDFPPGMAVAVLENPNQPWPLEPVRDQGWRARGYQRDEQRHPVFRIQSAEGVTVDEFIDPVIRESGVHLQRRFKVEGETMPLGLMLRLARSAQMEELGPRTWRTEEGVTLIVQGAAAEIYEVAGQKEIRVPISAPGTVVEVEVQW